MSEEAKAELHSVHLLLEPHGCGSVEKVERRAGGYASTMTTMSLEETAPLTLLLRLLPAEREASIDLLVSSAADEQTLSAHAADLILRVWRESTEVVRASITNVRSGNVAMIQGNLALRRLAEEIGLAVTPRSR